MTFYPHGNCTCTFNPSFRHSIHLLDGNYSFDLHERSVSPVLFRDTVMKLLREVDPEGVSECKKRRLSGDLIIARS